MTVPNAMSVTPGTVVRTETFFAQIVHLAEQKMLSGYAGIRGTAELARLEVNVGNELLLQLTAQCASGRLPSTRVDVTVEWPDGPWQAFKQKYVPRWILSRFPVRLARRKIETVTNHYFVCPHVELPGNRREHLQFMATGSPLATRMSVGEEP